VPLTESDIVGDAFIELGVMNAVDPMDGNNAALGLARLNMILDSWNGAGNGVFAQVFSDVTLTPALVPHTIGPTGTFVVASGRPARIDSASTILNNSRVPMWVRDNAWYRRLDVPSMAGALQTDVYYEPSWPNGSLYFWPVPTTPRVVTLEYASLLAQLASGDAFTLPPGYLEALTLTLAESLAAPMRVALSPETVKNASKARAQVFAANVRIPRIATADAGMPGGGAFTGVEPGHETGWT
jgi:hypothetical protein